MNETESVVDDVDSLILLSDSTIYSNLNDAVSIADSQDIDNEAGPIVKELEMTTKRELHNDVDEHDKQEKQKTKALKDRPPTLDDQKSTKNTQKETRILELEAPNSNSESSVKSKRTSKNKNQTPVASNEAVDLEENACGDEENSESEEMQDGATEELPFLRSVKYLEKHEIFRLFQNLAADIVYQRPDNPLQFIVEKLEKEKQEYRKSQKDSEKDQDSHSS